MTDSLQVKALLKGESLRKFKYIKQHYGLDTDAEVIRLCINDSFKFVELREKALDEITSERLE